MRLIDLLETAKETQDIIVRDDWALGIIYSKRFNCYVWCNKDGRATEDSTDMTGYKRVILSSKLLEEGNWYLTPNRIDKMERIEKLREFCNKANGKNYIEKRLEETINECNINKKLEEYYKLGLANAYGYIMYMLDQDFDKKDIKKFVIDGLKNDIQFRSDVYGVWGELYNKYK